jgi:hypothetical protein
MIVSVPLLALLFSPSLTPASFSLFRWFSFYSDMFVFLFPFSLIVVWVLSSLAISLPFLLSFFLSFSALQSQSQTIFFALLHI